MEECVRVCIVTASRALTVTLYFARAMSISVCICIMFVRSHNSKTAWPNFAKFSCMLPVAVSRSFYNGVAIRYVLPVIRMTSCFHTMGPMGGRAVRRCAVPVYVAADRARAAAAGRPARAAGLSDLAKYCDKYVSMCLSVCLSARITRKPHDSTSPNFCACSP